MTNKYIYFLIYYSLNQKQTATSKGASSYAWLYDYLYGCISYGCNIEVSDPAYGYWTWTEPLNGSSATASNVWAIARTGVLQNFGINNYTFGGIRPVITVSKSIF